MIHIGWNLYWRNKTHKDWLGNRIWWGFLHFWLVDLDYLRICNAIIAFYHFIVHNICCHKVGFHVDISSSLDSFLLLHSAFWTIIYILKPFLSDILTTWSIPQPPKQHPKQLQRSVNQRSNIRPPTVKSNQPSARPTRVTMRLPYQ